MMKNIVVLGAGLVGKAMILDLHKSYNVTAVDIDQRNLSGLEELQNINTVELDLSNSKNIKMIIKEADLVIGSVPGFMGFEMLRTVIESGKNIVDISFFPENPLELDKLAKERGVTAIVDCGVSPGMGNIILGHYINTFDVASYKCFVGGLPVKPEKPWGYKAVFSPIDVIEEYLRPVRYREDGVNKINDPLSKSVVIEFKDVGRFEAWNTDGLRTLLNTTSIPNLIEMTVRHTATIEPIIALRDSGFFSYDEIDVKGKSVKPIELTTKLMFTHWKMQPNEHDMTIMRIIIEGQSNGKTQEIVYNLVDYYDVETDTTSMARTTGYTCTAVANLMLEGKYDNVGVIPPEILGQDETAFDYIVKYLADRGVVYKKKD